MAHTIMSPQRTLWPEDRADPRDGRVQGLVQGVVQLSRQEARLEEHRSRGILTSEREVNADGVEGRGYFVWPE